MTFFPIKSEAMGSEDAYTYFRLAREFSPTIMETVLDSRYQPFDYQHMSFPSDGAYFRAMMDLHIFRELYTQWHHTKRETGANSTTTTAGGTKTTKAREGGIWNPNATLIDDPYGVNVGWGLNEEGINKAKELFEANKIVILRELLHPYELAVIQVIIESCIFFEYRVRGHALVHKCAMGLT